MSRPLLTKWEREVVDKLAEAWDLYLHLPTIHSCTRQEFMQAIHRAQHIVMSRPVQRQFNREEEK